MVTFNINPEKAVETIVYLANKKPNIDHYHVVKTIFYADKTHLNRYGRPVLGDKYIKMQAGPVPSLVLDIINLNDHALDPKLVERALDSFIITQDNKKKLISPKREGILDKFSESDLECLDEAFDFCKEKSFKELLNVSHKEKAWKEAENNGEMDYFLMLDDENPLKDGIAEDLLEMPQSLVF
ncbi:MAG: SocA family protein [Holosporales bacterium]|jgi:uncharacterized phage-associated protein|nr:SocA family protein [Holosporales bacterium]